ncbi:hypothetical protein K469DRAFT_784104 [Zopfia rhizophila CBS 207.26]|uniref:Uncharacterized protein n=1 Tax=Zopfia rhizophila CBS 207.26 TaxID=1314779 RepID=A0A6A6DZL9_9PEZI|nr:hypothetical protein K469DRAFT_784104 [Zopfia rhizophila CBS 207.26]
MNFTFIILEPNCSMVAACLPCYRPLFRGDRIPDSIVRSARWIFSPRSRGSFTDQITTISSLRT